MSKDAPTDAADRRTVYRCNYELRHRGLTIPANAPFTVRDDAIELAYPDTGLELAPYSRGVSLFVNGVPVPHAVPRTMQEQLQALRVLCADLGLELEVR
jgi:hypothetical protein